MKYQVKTILCVGLASLATSLAYAGGSEGGNGGDTCEKKVQNVRDDIESWIQGGGPSGLILPSGINVEQYHNRMLEVISGASKPTISCTDQKVAVGGAEKTCRNFSDATGGHIECNAMRIAQISESDQYVLIHHEYAGLAGLEINDGANSDYTLSNQITEFLQNILVKKLAVKKPSSSHGEMDTVISEFPKGTELSFKLADDVNLEANGGYTLLCSTQMGSIILEYRNQGTRRKLPKGFPVKITFGDLSAYHPGWATFSRTEEGSEIRYNFPFDTLKLNIPINFFRVGITSSDDSAKGLLDLAEACGTEAALKFPEPAEIKPTH